MNVISKNDKKGDAFDKAEEIKKKWNDLEIINSSLLISNN